MDSTDIAMINDPKMIMGRRVLDGWRPRSVSAPVSGGVQVIVQVGERSHVAGRRIVELQASCSQGARLLADAQPSPSGMFAHRIAQITKQDIVMGGYAADDTFGSPRGSRPGRPPV